jgi:hypothetical protein
MSSGWYTDGDDWSRHYRSRAPSEPLAATITSGAAASDLLIQAAGPPRATSRLGASGQLVFGFWKKIAGGATRFLSRGPRDVRDGRHGRHARGGSRVTSRLGVPWVSKQFPIPFSRQSTAHDDATGIRCSPSWRRCARRDDARDRSHIPGLDGRRSGD